MAIRGKMLVPPDCNLVPRTEDIGLGDKRACKVILAALDKEVVEDFTVNYSSVQLRAALKLRFGSGKAAGDRKVIMEYVDLLSNNTSVKPECNKWNERSNWRKIINIAQRYPISWFADDLGMGYLIDVVKYTMFFFW